MGQIGSIIAAPGRLALGYAERLLQGVTSGQFARFARVGNEMVMSNHPAFVFGHLALYPLEVARRLNKSDDALNPPTGYEELFKNGVECKDDPDGKIYPSMASILTFYRSSYDTILSLIEKLDDAEFVKENPAQGRMKELFPLLGGMIAFYVGGHQSVHLGQISAWRRMVGLPAA